MNTHDIRFNDLEKNLKELGIQLSTLRSNTGDFRIEIEGYFDPSIYRARNVREKFTRTPVDPAWPRPKPKKVRFSGPATIIIWEDGTKTVVKCQKEDVWSDEVGIGMCYLKKLFGNKANFNNIFPEAMKIAEVQYKKEDLTSPSADRPQGEWIVDMPNHKSICSVCGAKETNYIYGTEMWYGLGESKFCPSCGARMKGEKK